VTFEERYRRLLTEAYNRHLAELEDSDLVRRNRNLRNALWAVLVSAGPKGIYALEDFCDELKAENNKRRRLRKQTA
jgi:hypothetical protein